MPENSNETIRSAIAKAEEIKNPLEGLVERATKDPSVVFFDDVCEAMSALAQEDPAAFERLRLDLKKAGVPVSRLDPYLRIPSAPRVAASEALSPALLLTDLGAGWTFFLGPDGTAYADIEVNGHRETWPLRSAVFKNVRAMRYYEETGDTPTSESLRSAIRHFEGRAQFEGAVHDVHVRTAGHEDKIYIDIGDPNWRAIEVSADGWRIVDEPPVRFRRPAGYGQLPVPKPGGSIDTLRRYLNIVSDEAFVLVVAWLIAAFRPKKPCPVLVVSGEQGSAKSTFTRLLRQIVDPNSAPLRSLPKTEQDLAIAARNGLVLAFDNLSKLPDALSDALCRLATGGGFATRKLYSDTEEVLIHEIRPIIVNGIEEFVRRPDLADRSIFLTLAPIPDEARRTESALMPAFEADLPRILGAILDLLVRALKNLPATPVPGLPRMADFAQLSTVWETALWPAGTFMRAYESNRKMVIDNVIESDPVARMILALNHCSEWTGTATELLRLLTQNVDDMTRRHESWPKTPSHLSGRLRRAATGLRAAGIEIASTRHGRDRTRTIQLRRTPDFDAPTSPEATNEDVDPLGDPNDGAGDAGSTNDRNGPPEQEGHPPNGFIRKDDIPF